MANLCEKLEFNIFHHPFGMFTESVASRLASDLKIVEAEIHDCCSAENRYVMRRHEVGHLTKLNLEQWVVRNLDYLCGGPKQFSGQLQSIRDQKLSVIDFNHL